MLEGSQSDSAMQEEPNIFTDCSPRYIFHEGPRLGHISIAVPEIAYGPDDIPPARRGVCDVPYLGIGVERRTKLIFRRTV